VGSPPVVPSPLTSDLMKLFAFEAESAEDFELAEYYHKQVKYPTDVLVFKFLI